MEEHAGGRSRDAFIQSPPPSRSICCTTPGDVTMIQLVQTSHTIDGTLMDVPELLKRMDICTCAAAEKHTRVQCVTVRMGDVVLEYTPVVGDVLEVTARPVYVGTTSLDIALSVVAECGAAAGAGACGIDNDVDNEEHNMGLVEGSYYYGDTTRRVVCEAVFTYVTTRGPNGEKRLCPPLQIPAGLRGSEPLEWELVVAKYRKALVKMEQQKQQHEQQYCGSRQDPTMESPSSNDGFDLELTEVVLPAHQNHMGHTFGGIVMAWMARAALVAAVRVSSSSHRRRNALRVRSILRVDFHCGSDVSDHVLLRPRPTVVFDGGRSVEVEVRVSKRSLATGEETRMNVGYFYISGGGSTPVATDRTSTNDVPFGPRQWERWQSQSTLDPDTRQQLQQDAAWRRRLLLARQKLLSGVGSAVEWDLTLQQEAPLLTIASVLRLVHHRDQHSVVWYTLPVPSSPSLSTGTSQNLSPVSSVTFSAVEWTAGEAWGRKNSFVLRVKGVLRNARSTEQVLRLLKLQRPVWDDFCSGIDIVDESSSTEDSTCPIPWDLVRHSAVVPSRGTEPANYDRSENKKADGTVILCLLRTWQTDGDAGTAILATQSVSSPKVDLVSAQVRPSGWFMRRCGEVQEDGLCRDGVQLTYTVEHDFMDTRAVCLGMSDRDIVDMMATIATGWFDKIGSMLESSSVS